MILLDVSPGANVSVPLTGMKSLPAVAVPFDVLKSTDTGDALASDNSTVNAASEAAPKRSMNAPTASPETKTTPRSSTIIDQPARPSAISSTISPV